ncbi:MAG: TRAP transporter TatT component family protein [Gammaproteobacteria bacterium]|jgi:hypothetical protein
MRLLTLTLALPLATACSMGQMVARSSVSIMDGNIEAMDRETDLALAEAAIPANLKLIEGLINEDPHNLELLASAARGFYGYAFGFVELDDRRRAEALYGRGFEFGLRGLKELGVDIDLRRATLDEIDAAVVGLDREAVPALFWTASCWAKQIDLNRDDPARLAEVSSTERLMHRVLELQPDYYYGSVHVYYGVYYGSRAPMLGGDFARSEQSFAQANAVTGGRLLIVDVLQAEYLERQRLNREAFHRLLTGVLETPVGTFPEMGLANQIARTRAKYLLGTESDWF